MTIWDYLAARRLEKDVTHAQQRTIELQRLHLADLTQLNIELQSRCRDLEQKLAQAKQAETLSLLLDSTQEHGRAAVRLCRQ